MNPSTWTPAEVIAVIGSLSAFVAFVGKTIIEVMAAARATKAIAEVKNDLAVNTELTKAGTQEATGAAKEAVATAEKSVTAISEVKDQLNGAMDARILAVVEAHPSIADHGERLTSLESQMATMKLSIEGVAHNIDTTRHEMRSHMQTIITNQFAAMAGKPLTSSPAPETPNP